MRAKTFLLTCVLIVLSYTHAQAKIIYVDDDATGANDGSSWQNAYVYLRDALTTAESDEIDKPLEIRVAQGNYKPDQGAGQTTGDREATFQLKDGVALYGGFPSGGGSWEERDPNMFVTILSGDLLDNDGDPNEIDLIEDESRQDNSLHVITVQGIDTGTILDGFTVQGGNANIDNSAEDGGGMYNDSGSPTVSNCIFLENSCLDRGGAIYDSKNSSHKSDCLFTTNKAGFGGGGVCADRNSDTNIIHCQFEKNTALVGAGIFVDPSGKLTINHCIISNNNATYSGGGIYTQSDYIQITNCVMTHNSAKRYGGALSVNGDSAVLDYCTITQNTATTTCGGIDFHSADKIKMSNSIVWGNIDSTGLSRQAQLNYFDLSESMLSFCCVQFFEEIDANHLYCRGNIGLDPLLEDDGFHLTEGSPCINGGDPNVSADLATDIDGQARVQMERADIGADESPFWREPPELCTGKTIFVDQNATGINDGSSWANAFGSLQDAINSARNRDQIWVAQGIYKPDQGNSITSGDREATFQLPIEVAIYGGFPSGGGSWEERDPNTFTTILSGDLLDNDGEPNEIDLVEDESRQDNSLHVIISNQWVDEDTILDGFTVQGGNASSESQYNNWGGGLFNELGSPTISNCIFWENSCLQGGGAICCVDSNSLIVDCVIRDNVARTKGGGMYCSGDPQIIRSFFTHNMSDSGGGITVSQGSATISECIFLENDANKGGGISSFCKDEATLVGNCVFIDNHANYGAGARLNGNMIMNHCTLTGNTADIENGGIFITPFGSLQMTNSIIWGNIEAGAVTREAQLDWFEMDNSILRNCCIQFWTERSIGHPAKHLIGMGNIGDDPLLAPDGFHLTLGSPCINAAEPNFSSAIETDIDGQPRVQFGGGDIGADEYLYTGPVAKAGKDISKSDLNLVTLDGTESWDPWGQELQYIWYQVEGPSVILEQSDTCYPYFIPSEPNIYVFELVVNNGSADSTPDTIGVMAGNNLAPVAVVESHRYVGSNFMLIGSGSYDPDGFGELSYHWQQVSGLATLIADANVSTPMVTVTQNNDIQQCVFSLVVSDGDLVSNEALQDITIVPAWNPDRNTLIARHFDPNKPTIISFGGGNCYTGMGGAIGEPQWSESCNNFHFGIEYYVNSYQDYGDILMAFLSAYAPDYCQLIQTAGFSTGGVPAINMAIYMNQTYVDSRYTVNRVTLLDGGCIGYAGPIEEFYDSIVPGEICWVENYSASSTIFPYALNVHFKTNPPAEHATPPDWYNISIDPEIWETDMYNHGITAGFFTSSIGPAGNLQLAPHTTYVFQWIGDRDDGIFYQGEMELKYPSQYPATFPEPVTLIGPSDGTKVDANGVVLSCEESENAVSYQLLLGDASDNMTVIFLDLPTPPAQHIDMLPFDKTYWTIKVRDVYGATIYADPRYLLKE